MPRDRARAGFALRDPLPWHELVELVGTAEQTGFEALFLPEITGREAFATLAGLAGVTSTLLLATGVVAVPTRRPSTAAMAAATVHELSGGRMVLGVGTGPSGLGALDRLRGYVRVLRTLLSGEAVELDDGETFKLSLAPRERPIPIWIAALGPKAMHLAGETADGVLLNWCPPERVAFAKEQVRQGAEAVGREPGTVTVAVYIRACVGQEDDVALPPLRRAAGQYAAYPAYRRQFEAVGMGEEAAAAGAAHRAGRPEEVPERLVRAVCLLGDPGRAAAGLQTYRDAGADLPVVYPVPCLEPFSSIMGTLFALAPSPAVES